MTTAWPPIGAATRVFALLGDPVLHSASPRFQNAALRHLGLDAIYVALRCAAGDAPALLRALARAGGGGNVTVPHKLRVVEALDVRTPAVERTGACNTFWLEDGRIHGDNTDVVGFAAAVRSVVPDPAGMRVLLLGAGGAARAAALALLDLGVAGITVANRTPERARELCERIDPARMSVTAPDALPAAEGWIVVDATTRGMHGDDAPIPDAAFGGAGAVLDLVVRPGGTPLVRRARALGVPAADGSVMLLEQGAAAFRRWWRREPPLDVMRTALESATAG